MFCYLCTFFKYRTFNSVSSLNKTNTLLTKKISHIKFKIFMMLYFIKPKKEKRFRPMMNTSRKSFASFELLDNIEP